MNAFIVAAFALRLVPYGLSVYLAWHKGYKRLSIYVVLLIATASVNLSATSQEQRAVMAFALSLFLLLHTIALPPRAKR